jgi:hypothetical protein
MDEATKSKKARSFMFSPQDDPAGEQDRRVRKKRWRARRNEIIRPGKSNPGIYRPQSGRGFILHLPKSAFRPDYISCVSSP